MVVLETTVLLAAAGVLVWLGLRREPVRAGTWWAAAWGALFASGRSAALGTAFPVHEALAGFFGGLFPFYVLAGCLRYADRRLPAWLAPVALGVGLARVALLAGGLSGVEEFIGIADNAILLVAAVVAHSAVRLGGSIAQRALPAAFVVLAIVDVLSGVVAGGQVLLVPWAGVVLAVALLQFVALLDRAGGSREVAEARSAALARANTRLLREIGERRNAERALRHSEERYRRISELMSDYSYAVRVEDGRLVGREWLTGAFERITGYAPGEIGLSESSLLVHPEDLPRIDAVFRSLRPGDSSELEYRIVTKSGAPRWIRERLKMVHDAETGHLRLLGAAHDVTDRKRAEEEGRKLEARVWEAQKLDSLGALAGGIAHDFNNLLTVILGNAAIVHSELPPLSPLRGRVERLQKAAQVAAGLTGQMLTYAGGTTFELKPLDLSRAVEDMEDLLRTAVAKDAEVDFDCAVGLPAIQGEASQVRQVILNLVTNAAEALPERGGRIDVSTGVLEADAALLADAKPSGDLSPGRYVVLEVRDNGMGMDEATLARVFEPFYSTKFSGRGLGLAAVLGIVRGHGGGILVESEPGRGTRFRALFPAAPAETRPEEPAAVRLRPATPTASARGRAASPAARERPANVLVVDDDESVRELSGELLRRAGYAVLEAGSGEDAVRVFDERADEIDLVLLDLVMPDMPGDRVLEAMRARRPDVVVLLASGHPEEVASARLGSGGVGGFVQKPYEPEDLLARVGGLVSPAPGREPGRRETP